MSDDASTAYICIYCPFNSDNLQALENHLSIAHEHGGCQDTLTPNIITKVNKREAPDDEKSRSSFDDTEESTEHPSGVKRVKRTASPQSTNLYLNSGDEHIESEEDDDERDSSSNSKSILTCPLCGIIYDSLEHLLKHGKRKHQLDLNNFNRTNSFQQLSTENFDQKNSNETIEIRNSNQEQNEILPSTSESNTTTDCPYCDYKTTDTEQFKAHIIGHIRDKNYRCLLCNRLYKYRGDCSFHIRRKHHRYSANSNDYIQRFLFDTTDGDESISNQSGLHGISSTNGSTTTTNFNTSRELEEPVRYFGCPYCDYTSNYGGDVRKHQARKHPNAESKVIKIIRRDSEMNKNTFIDDNDGDGEDNSNQTNHLTTKIKSNKKSDKSIPLQTTSMPLLSNFAPVRVFQCSACHQQGTYKWVVERHIRAKHPEQANVHVIELPAELSVKLQKITSPLKRFRCSLCPLQSKHSWVVVRHIKHFHTLQTASVLDIQPDGKPINEDLLANPNGELSNHHDSDSSSASSSYNEPVHQGTIDDESIPTSLNNHLDSMIFTYKCSLCDYQSDVSWNIQKHINEIHSDQNNAIMLTQCRSRKLSSNDFEHSKTKKFKGKNGCFNNRSLSPTSALARAKFSPAVEEALLSLQGSKLNSNLYAVQPKFGIKRLKCRHCFYRSNWKTDMIRHVRIRHNLTEPDHNKDMITMTEQEARSTIELYENTFGKELRRRTFRTWNDWTKAEQEFNPKDGSLQYMGTNNGQSMSDSKTILSNKGQKSSNKIDSSSEFQEKISSIHFNQITKSVQDEFKQLPNPSNIVSRLLLTTSPSDNHDNDEPLDLSLKSSKIEIDQNEEDLPNENSSVNYLCSVCPYKHSNWSLVQSHLSLHLNGHGYVCPLCSYTKSTSNSIIHHMTISHSTSQIPRKFSSTSVNLTAHILEQHQCSLCSYQCDCLDALNLHRRLEHDDEEFDIDSSDDDDDVIASTTKNLFDCPLCSPSSNTSDYTNLEQLTMHVIIKHNNQSCPFCSFVSHTNNNSIEHVKLHFNGTLIQPDPLIGIEQVKELLMLE